MKTFNIKLTLVILIASIVTGCVGIQPFPYFARAGDTITLAVGSLDGANRDNVSVLYYADSAPLVAIDMTQDVDSVLKIYPDKTSLAYWDQTSAGGGAETISFQTNNANHGPWQSIIVVDLPLTVPAGTGHFEITFGSDVIYPNFVAKVDDVNIPLEILADTSGNALFGEAHDFEYRKAEFNTLTNLGDLQSLEPAKQVVVKLDPSGSRSAVEAAAASYELIVPVLDAGGTDVSDQLRDDQFAVILDDRSDLIRNQVGLNWSRSGNQFKVVVTSLTGLQDFHKIRYSILISDIELEPTNGWVLGTPTLVSAQFYDVNGDDITGSVIPPQIVLQ